MPGPESVCREARSMLQEPVARGNDDLRVVRLNDALICGF